MAIATSSFYSIELTDAIQKDEIDGDAIKNDDIDDGDDEMVRAMTPLQFAVVHGCVDEIPALVAGCPSSIEELTSKNQTVFHLAAELCFPAVFAVLLSEAKKRNKEYLLDAEDCHGNTVLHIAVSNKQFRIVKTCLSDRSSTAGFPIRVNAMNMKGETALDLCLKIPDPDNETGHICRILHERSRREEVPLFKPRRRHPKRSTTHPWQTLKTKNGLLVVLALFIALAFSITCALPTFFPKESMAEVGSVLFEFNDLLYGHLPLQFYIITFISVLLTSSICILSMLLYSFPYGSLMLLGGFATFMLYLLLAYFLMPKFTVRVGSIHVSSYHLMMILALGFIIIGVPIIQMSYCLMRPSYNHLKFATRKVVRKIWSPNNNRLPMIQMAGHATSVADE